jgi:hypothetical protein
VWLHAVFGAVALSLILPLVATQLQPASYVFGHFEVSHAEGKGINHRM